MSSPNPRLEKALSIFGGIAAVAGVAWVAWALWQSNTTAAVWFDNGEPARAMIVRVGDERFDVSALSSTAASLRSGHRKLVVTDGAGSPISELDVDIVAGKRYVLNIATLNRYKIMEGSYGGEGGAITEADVPPQEWYDVSSHSFILSGLPEQAKGRGRLSAFMRLDPVPPTLSLKNSSSTAMRWFLDGVDMGPLKVGASIGAKLRLSTRRLTFVDEAGKQVGESTFIARPGASYEIDAAKPAEIRQTK